MLRIDIEEITSTRDGGDEGQHAFPAAPLIEQAMMHYGMPGARGGDGEPQPDRQVGHLREMARSAYQGYQATRYDATGRLLPQLIRGVETASRTEGVLRSSVSEVRALVYDTAAALLNRVGEPSLALTAADRAMTAAEYSGEPLLAALAAWRLSYIIPAGSTRARPWTWRWRLRAILSTSCSRRRPSSSACTAPCTWPPSPRRRPSTGQ